MGVLMPNGDINEIKSYKISRASRYFNVRLSKAN